MSGNPFNVFDEIFCAAPTPASEEPPTEPPQIVAGEESAKLNRNLNAALDRQGEILSHPITAETSPRDKRLIADVANHIVRVAVSVEAQRLKTRRDDEIFEEISLILEREKKHLDATRLEEQMRLDTGPSRGPN
jgi:hypothetical protein